MYIAENFRANIRELEGALLKVVASAQVVGQPITLPLAERAIKDLVRQTAAGRHAVGHRERRGNLLRAHPG